VPPTGGPAGWTSRGGTSITVAAGDSLDGISNRYGVPPAAILSANGLKAAGQIAPGKQIVIPVYQASDAGGGAPAVTPRPAKVAEAPTSAQTKFRFAEGAKPAATPVRAEAPSRKEAELSALRERVARLESEKAAKAAAKDAKSAPASKAVASAADSAKVAASSKVAAKAESAKLEASKATKAEPQKFAKLESPKAAPKVVEPVSKPTPVVASKPEPAKAPEAAKPAIKEPEQTASIAAKPADDGNFRWPARGRVISGYGASGNEGINIAVPEGTPVKAAEEGTVAYAGSDVKGYGNLVLIRHANGYVSAYAHNGDISVKPGEKVKRGQVVAKSGQSGNVTSPQLHFEIRKGATPVDPTPHLASN
jgi:murein DD-endopeptidase MepM/ murein hydrolase activator NlpD